MIDCEGVVSVVPHTATTYSSLRLIRSENVTLLITLRRLPTTYL